jgi:hypothetical protein
MAARENSIVGKARVFQRRTEMPKKVILGVMVNNRLKEIPPVQNILTEYGCYIRTRLGLHETGKDCCAPGGLLILELIGAPAKLASMEGKLKKITGVVVKKMVF